MTIIRRYINGNCHVTLHDDGTKEREWDGTPHPVFPESIDLKITNYCDRQCPFCHEESTTSGVHAPTNRILDIVGNLPSGVEIAIGGGNPLDHPDIVPIASEMNGMGLVPNMTCNIEHIMSMQRTFTSVLPFLYGIGLSNGGIYDVAKQIIPELNNQNVILHAIAGVDDPMDYMHSDKLLILGYKNFGRGKQYYGPNVETNLRQWRYWLPRRMRNGIVTSFDNLALEQLHVRSLLDEKMWTQLFMGNDGEFTMYVDAVRDEFAISSTSSRQKLDGKDALSAWRSIISTKVQTKSSRTRPCRRRG